MGLSYGASPTELVYSIEACGSTAFINALPVREGTIDELDVDHLRRVADALPPKRFLTYIVLAKLWPFTAEEIALAKPCTTEILAEQFS